MHGHRLREVTASWTSVTCFGPRTSSDVTPAEAAHLWGREDLSTSVEQGARDFRCRPEPTCSLELGSGVQPRALTSSCQMYKHCHLRPVSSGSFVTRHLGGNGSLGPWPCPQTPQTGSVWQFGDPWGVVCSHFHTRSDVYPLDPRCRARTFRAKNQLGSLTVTG